MPGRLPYGRAGGYVLGLEPSCTAVFRADAPELFPDDQDVRRLRDHMVTLAEAGHGEIRRELLARRV